MRLIFNIENILYLSDKIIFDHLVSCEYTLRMCSFDFENFLTVEYSIHFSRLFPHNVHRLVTSNFGDFVSFFDWLPRPLNAIRLVLVIAFFAFQAFKKPQSREPIVLQ